jgi:carbonic anhydrase
MPHRSCTLDLSSDSLEAILSLNHQWAAEEKNNNPGFFEEQVQGQSPPILWFGCSDSRVPPTDLTKLRPGDIFVHRNIGNTYYVEDFNANAVISYAVKVLGVRHVIVCGIILLI